MDDTELDDIILSFVSEHWQNTIDIVEQTLRACAADGLDPGARAIGNRINALVKDGHIESSGSVLDWRTGTIRFRQVSA